MRRFGFVFPPASRRAPADPKTIVELEIGERDYDLARTYVDDISASIEAVWQEAIEPPSSERPTS